MMFTDNLLVAERRWLVVHADDLDTLDIAVKECHLNE